MDDPHEPNTPRQRLTSALRRVVLLRETGPKSAAWHRARAQTIWRLHHAIERLPDEKPDRPDSQD